VAKVFAWSDTHYPYHDKRAYIAAIRHIKQGKFTHIVQLGDLLDQYVFGRYPRSLNIRPRVDIEKGLMYASQMWDDIQEVAPRAKLFQLIGNHDVRVNKRIQEKMPELSEFFSHKDWYNFGPKVQVADGDRDYIEIEGVVYCHGWYSKSIDHAKFFNKPTVHGHTHGSSITYDFDWLWSMSCGFMANKKLLPLKYTMSKLSKWTLSCGEVAEKQPRLIVF
jgi:predicted phosphodiesterase